MVTALIWSLMHGARPNAANVTVTVVNSTDTAANIAALNAALRRSAMPQSALVMAY